jgi:hypothetical protein
MPSISADSAAIFVPICRHDGVAFDEVGDEARILFAEAHERLVLLLHATHGEAALAAIAPGGIDQRRQHGLGRDVADALQVLQQHALLDVDLFGFVEVLQRAAAAGAEVRAARGNAIGRSDEHLERACLVEMAMARGLLRDDGFAQQGAGHEDRFARTGRLRSGPTGDAAPVMAEVGDLDFERGLVEAGPMGDFGAWGLAL